MVAYSILTVICAHAQLVTNTTQIPRTPGKPPVVFVNGYQSGCPTTNPATFAGTFGSADQVMQRDGRVSLFFNNCEHARNLRIEEIGNKLRDFLAGLRYADGQVVTAVDIVAHSMGGLIVRSYLSGKQADRGVFTPPVGVPIRKAVFLATPFFGAVAATLPGAPSDIQTQQMLPGSQFLFDLATWNQFTDNLRGIDAIAVAANAGTGLASGVEKFDDSTVVLTSASLEFAAEGRTRVVPYCHTVLSGLLAAACSPNRSIANWSDEQHDAARIALSFFNGNDAWKSTGTDIRDTTRRGLFVQLRDAEDRAVPIDSALPLAVRSSEIAWSDRLQTDSLNARLTTTAGEQVFVGSGLPAATTKAVIAKPAGPSIAAVIPSAGPVTPRAVAPGMFASIYGTNLTAAIEQAQALPYPTTLANTQVLASSGPLQLHYASPTQINAVIPPGAQASLLLTVRGGTGQQTIRVLVEPAVPTLFAGAVTNAITGALITASSPANRGEYITIYLTGLGATEARGGLDWAVVQPEVTVGGRPCAVLQYAGRSPGYTGLDQINCQVAPDAAVGAQAEIRVRSGARIGTGTVALR